MAAKSSAVGIGSFLSLIFFGFILFKLFTCSYSEDNMPRKADANDAYLIAISYVRQQLKSPPSADFPSYETKYGMDMGDSTFMIISYVDSDNSFGTKIRTSYTCELKYKGGEPFNSDNWRIVTLKFR